MADTEAMAGDAKQFAVRHGISVGKIIEVGAKVIGAVIALASGQAADEEFQMKIHGQKYAGHVVVQLTPPKVLFSLEPAP